MRIDVETSEEQGSRPSGPVTAQLRPGVLSDDAIEALCRSVGRTLATHPRITGTALAALANADGQTAVELRERVLTVITAAAYPLIAARVRAEALREAAQGIAPNHVRPSQVIIVGARMTEAVLELVRDVENWLVAAVRAEAVADERRRTLELVERVLALYAESCSDENFEPNRDDPTYALNRGSILGQAAGWHNAANMAKLIREGRNRRLWCERSDEHPPHFTKSQAFGREIRSVCEGIWPAAGSVPVATPTEPDQDMLGDVDRLRSMWRESPGTRAYVEDRYPGLAHAIERAVMHEVASPVPAEQPLSPSDHTDLFGMSVSDAIAEQPEERAAGVRPGAAGRPSGPEIALEQAPLAPSHESLPCIPAGPGHRIPLGLPRC